jgi:hypothetical protein
VAGAVFQHVRDIPDELVLELVSEALLLDERVPYKSKRR